MKTTKILLGCALGLQAVTIIITLLITALQQGVKTLFGGAPQILEVSTFPAAYLVTAVCPAIFYLMLLVLAKAMENRKNAFKTLAVVFFGLLCLVKILLEYLPMVETALVARSGVEKLASLSTLNSAINMTVTPFSVVAFGFFAMAAGISVCGKDKGENL